MEENVIFDRLVSGLPLGERQNLLQKLNSYSDISGDPLYVDDEKTASSGDLSSDFSALPWYYRLWYFILSFFKNKAPMDIFGDHQVAVLGKKIEERAPGVYDYQERMLLPAFYLHIERLKEASRFFYTALDTSVNRDKGAFFAFLGSLEMPDIHKYLEAETDPKAIAQRNPGITETELRQIAFRAMEGAFALITEDQRNTMYSAARSLNCLKGLSSFLFDRLMMAFAMKPAQNGMSCPVNVAKDLLVTLNNILLSLKIVPPMTLLQSLFIFILQERSSDPGFNIDREINLLSTKAEQSLAVIRDFNKQVPLAWIIRCAARNMSFTPREMSGGEDWFAVYRDYWKRRIDLLYAACQKDRRRRELLAAFQGFLNGAELKPLENIESTANPGGVPVKGAFALSFLLAFNTTLFIPEINRILKPVLLEGEFDKAENRLEFTESYNILMRLETDIKKFEQDISPSGDYGKRYAQVRQDISSLPVKRRKIQLALDDIRRESETILKQVKEASFSMINLLNGILGHDTKGRYGTLTNFTAIAGKDGLFTTEMDKTIQQFETLSELLNGIDIMETVEDGR